MILAVAPDSRKVGCYFGEDVKVMSSQEDDIQEAAKSQFREKDWDGGSGLHGEEVHEVRR